MRNPEGWLVWWWQFGPLTFGIDLATWGIGFISNFRYPRGAGLTLGPFYLSLEGPELAEWTGNQLDRFGNFVARQLDRFDDWIQARRGRRGK